MVRISDDSETHDLKIEIIREVYDNENAYESFQTSLEKALAEKCDYIIIEPTRLGDETGRWIHVGNCLHKTALLSGLSSIVAGVFNEGRPIFSTPLCAISVFCAGLYTVSWSYDHCVHYQAILAFEIDSFIQLCFNSFLMYATFIKYRRSLTNVRWRIDKKAEVVKNPTKLQNLSFLDGLSSPTVLEYSDNKRGNLLHIGISLLATTICAWQLYRVYK